MKAGPVKRAAATPRTKAPATPDRSLALAIACARAADDKLAEDTLILDLRGHRAVCDFFVVTTATSSPHLRAVDAAMQDAGELLRARLHHREGDPASPWVLLDFFDVICHIFDGPTRKFYDLERLWADARRIKWEKPKPRAKPKKG